MLRMDCAATAGNSLPISSCMVSRSPQARARRLHTMSSYTAASILILTTAKTPLTTERYSENYNTPHQTNWNERRHQLLFQFNKINIISITLYIHYLLYFYTYHIEVHSFYVLGVSHRKGWSSFELQELSLRELWSFKQGSSFINLWDTLYLTVTNNITGVWL